MTKAHLRWTILPDVRPPETIEEMRGTVLSEPDSPEALALVERVRGMNTQEARDMLRSWALVATRASRQRAGLA